MNAFGRMEPNLPPAPQVGQLWLVGDKYLEVLFLDFRTPGLTWNVSFWLAKEADIAGTPHDMTVRDFRKALLSEPSYLLRGPGEGWKNQIAIQQSK